MRLIPIAILVAGVAACSDPNQLPDAQITNVVDTFTISALTGTPIASPSAYSIADRRPIRTDLTSGFDFAFDILPGSGQPVLLPRSALGFPSEGALLPGLQKREELFAAITEGVTNGYLTRDTVVVAVGERFIGRSRVVCSSLGVPKYGKFEILAIDPAARTITVQGLVNENCGYINLEPGLPEE
jgi:hypothetical protein